MVPDHFEPHRNEQQAAIARQGEQDRAPFILVSVFPTLTLLVGGGAVW
jgi:hypothetical protein